MTGQAVMLIAGAQTATPVPTFTATVVPTPVPTATVVPTSVFIPATISFVGTGSFKINSATAVTTVTVGPPSGVRAGDVSIAQIAVYDGSGSDVPTAPGGWNSIRHDAINSGNQITSWLFYKVAGANEPSSYGWNISSNWAAGVIGAWRNASSSPIDSASGSAAAGSSPVSVSAPALTATNSNELQVYFYGAQSHAAPVVTLPSALNERFDTGSSKEGFTLAFGDLAAASVGSASATILSHREHVR